MQVSRYAHRAQEEGPMEEFIRCYEEIYPRMYKTAYYYLKNAEEAKDAVQDASLISYENGGSCGKKKSMRHG